MNDNETIPAPGELHAHRCPFCTHPGVVGSVFCTETDCAGTILRRCAQHAWCDPQGKVVSRVTNELERCRASSGRLVGLVHLVPLDTDTTLPRWRRLHRRAICGFAAARGWSLVLPSTYEKTCPSCEKKVSTS